MLKEVLAKIFGNWLFYKQCPHGATSWYICPKCKKEHPEWKPFEGEGPYNPNL